MNSWMRWKTACLALTFLLATIPSVAEEDSAPPRISIGEKGLRVQTADGKFKFKFGGRLHADASVHIGDTPGTMPDGTNRDATDGTEIRRARLLAKATLYEDWNWVGEVDFEGNKVALKDFALGYSGFDDFTLTVGHQKQPFSLDIEMSSNDNPFIERGVDNELISIVVDRAIGIRGDAHGKNWFAAAGFYGDGARRGDANATEGWGSAAKLVLTPIRQDDKLLHLGFRGAYRRPETANDSLRFRDETTHMSDYRVVDTDTIENIREVVLYGPEAALAIGPFSIFGEYNRAVVRRKKHLDTLSFESGHVGVTWTLTGESRAAAYRIKSGEFKRLRPRNNFSLKNGGIGAWELAARYAYINVTDGSASNPGSVNGGREQAITAALNWYPNPVVRLMLDWTHILETGASTSAFNQEAKGLNIIAFRTQFTF